MSKSHGVIGRTANEAFHEPCSWQRGASVAVDVGLFDFRNLINFRNLRNTEGKGKN